MPSILICAPSNAAIDEIIIRILNRGLINSDSKKFIPNILRLGFTSEKKKSEDISVITLEYILKNGLCNKNSMQYKQHIYQKIEACKQDLISLTNMNNYQGKYEDIKAMKYKMIKLQNEFDACSGDEKMNLKIAESKVINNADIIICTLSTSAT